MFNSFYNKGYKKKGNNPPLMSIREIAENFGVSVNHVRYTMGESMSRPKVKFVSGSTNFYNKKELELWAENNIVKGHKNGN